MKYLKKYSLLLLILCPILSFAQQNGQLIGIINDANTGNSVEFVTISVFNAADSSLITGSVTDAAGQFNIALPNGNFTALIEAVAYQNKSIEPFTISKDNPQVNLGEITLSAYTNTLSEIEVVAEKSSLQFSLDKKVFNVGKDLQSAGAITDVLDNIPSVSVDPNGRVKFRESQSVKILIDGKPSILTSANLLQNIPAAQVEKVEIITNPAAKYDAEGLTGIINIVLKKADKVGFSGSLNASVSHPQEQAVSVSLQRRKNKINLFTNIGLRHWERPREEAIENQFTYPDTSYFSKINTEKTRRSYSANVNIGLDYYLDSTSTVTSSFLYDLARQPHDATTFYQDFAENDVLSGNQLRKNKEFEAEYSLEYLLNFEKKFAKKGQQLNTFVKYIDNTENNDSDITQFATDANKNPLNLAQLQQRTTLDENDRQFIFQLDFQHPFSDQGTIELGAKSTFRNIENSFLVEENREQGWQIQDGLSNDFLYAEKVYALYASVDNKVNGFSYKFGLRSELTDLKTTLQQTNEVNNRKPFLDLFPSAHLGYKFKNGHGFQASYSRRIQRPAFQDLNPFFSFTNERFIAKGNPDLNPMYTNSFEVGYLKSGATNSLGSSIYHRKTTDYIETVLEIDLDGITFATPQNISNRRVSGMEIFVEQSLKKWLVLNGSLDIIRSKINSDAANTNPVTINNSWTGRLGAKFKLPNKTAIQLRYFYRAPNTTLQGTTESLSRFDVTVKKQVLQGKGKLSLSVYDLFYNYQIRYRNETDELISVGVAKPWRPTVRLGFQYRWK